MLSSSNCLDVLFNEFEDVGQYAVLRNGESLPRENNSNDIDILVEPAKLSVFRDRLFKVMVEFDYTRVEETIFHGIECRTFYNISHNAIRSIKIDLFCNIEGGGILYHSFIEIERYRERNQYGVFVLNSRIEAYVSTLKMLVAGGKVKQRYINKFGTDAEQPILEPTLINALHSPYLRNLIVDISITRKNPSVFNRIKALRQTLYRNVLNNPLGTIFRLVKHYYLEVSRIFKIRYIFAFVGPDGAGKSTLVDHLISLSVEVFRSVPSRFVLYHHRPHILPTLSDIMSSKIDSEVLYDREHNPHSGSQSGSVVSCLKVIYYAMDYLLGYVIKVIPDIRMNKFIVFDRYFYDFIVDQERSAISISARISSAIYWIFVPKPKKVFFIYSDPKQANLRKNELTVAKIKTINDRYDLLCSDFSYFVRIDNSNLDAAKHDIAVAFIMSTTVSLLNVYQ